MSSELTEGSSVVVVGGGHGAAAFLAQLRARGYAGALCLVSSEPFLPYLRPPLSKKALGEHVDVASLAIRPATWYVEQGVQLRLATEVVAIDRARRCLSLRDVHGPAELGYDVLVLATGVAPRRWRASGADEVLGPKQGVYVLRDADDAQALGTAMRSARCLVVIGGGYIGLEVAASARRLGLTVTVVEQAPRILARVAAPPTAEGLKAVHQKHGVTLLEGAQVQGFVRTGDGPVTAVRVTRADGEAVTLAADLVLVGIGGVPRDALARDARLEVDNGILVDQRGCTADPAVWSLGDVARVRGSAQRLESVASANEQGARVAAALMGDDPAAPGVPWFWSEQFEGRLQIAGLWNGSDHWVQRRDGAGWSVWSFRDSQLQAVDAWQAPLAYALGKKWLETGQTPDSAWLEDSQHALKDWQGPMVRGTHT